MSRKTSIIIVVIFVALASIVLWNRAVPPATPTLPPSDYGPLWSFRMGEVQTVQVSDHVNQLSVAVERSSAEAPWMVVVPPAFPQASDPNSANLGVSGLSVVNVTTITTSSELSAFGVLSPTYTIEVSLTNGQRLKLAVGDKTPTGSQYYAIRDGEQTVMLVSDVSLKTVLGWLTTPPIAPTPTVVPLVLTTTLTAP